MGKLGNRSNEKSLKMVNKLSPADIVIIDQALASLTVAVRQFRKTPNSEIGEFAKTSAERISVVVGECLARVEGLKVEVKINGTAYEPWFDEESGKMISHLPKPNDGESVTKGG